MSFRAVWFSCLVLLPLSVGCRDRVHSFVGMGAVQLSDAGTGSGGTGSGGSGGAMGTGGQSGGTGGADMGGTGGAACVPSGPETCGNIGIDNNCNGDPNDVDPSELTDTANCGACFNLCNQANATNIQCLKDTTTGIVGCHYTCLAGFKDQNGDSKDGCECHVESAIELCNQKDDNCNGVIDEGFDLMTDTANCGRCGVVCTYPFARSVCNMGTCAIGACLPGFFDANTLDSDGCECQKTNGGVEVCDGIDNNCDGRIDEAANLTGALTCKSQGVCAGTPPQCNGLNGWSCDYAAHNPLYQTVENKCDQADNDCNGAVDEGFNVGGACTVGTGPCANPAGQWACDSSGGRTCTGQMRQPTAELCNGIDDNCDGRTDELVAKADGTPNSDDKLVYFAARNVTMFAYEATWPAAGSPVIDLTHRPCSVPGKAPWTNITKEEAAAACGRVGPNWRLCTGGLATAAAPIGEWPDACNGMGNTLFPYANTYSATTCVGYDYTAPTPNTAPALTGAATLCISHITAAATDQLHDMSGNVKEWALTTAPGVTPASYEMRGGAYDNASFTVNGATTAPGLQCDSLTPAPSVAVRLPSVGFRCCLTGRLP